MNTLNHTASLSVEIVQQLKQKIQSGEWAAGVSLPPIRQLASELGVSPNTVALAYNQLKAAGLVQTDGRRGTQVAFKPTHMDLAPVIPSGLIDLASGNVNARYIPQPAPRWLKQQSNATGYDANGDDPQLLDLMRTWLQQQAIPVQALAVFSGTLEVMGLALRTQLCAGDAVWVEDPCWPPVLDLLKQLRLVAIPLPVDAEGCSVPQPNSKIKAVILTLRAQNPTGVSFNHTRWQAWQNLLKQQPQTLVLLDDYWGVLAQQSLADLTMRNPCLYILSVSKFLGPDLRVTLVNGNANLIADLQYQQALSTRWVSLWLQRLTAHLWQTRLVSTLASARHFYAAQQRQFQQHLQQQGIMLPIQGEGINCWLPVNNEAQVIQHLSLNGWAAQAGQAFRTQAPPGIRLSLSNLNATQMQAFAAVLKQSLSQHKRAWV